MYNLKVCDYISRTCSKFTVRTWTDHRDDETKYGKRPSENIRCPS